MKPNLHDKAIVFFDGDCGLCSRSVNFIIKHDKRESFLFCPLQSGSALEILPDDYINSDALVLYDSGNFYKASNAAFRILKKLSTIWRILLIFSWLPLSVTDFFYNLIARVRKRLFPPPENCKLPSIDISKRLID